MSEKICDTCLYQGPFNKDECYAEQCNDDFSGWRNRVEEIGLDAPLMMAMGKAYNTYKYKFSLDKLIDDHWKYNEGLVRLCFPYGVDGWETDDILRLVEFAYKQSGKHFWKHCKEHYNINGESNE